MIRVFFYLAFLLVFSLISCGGEEKNEKIKDTPVSGELRIYADESFLPIIEAQAGTFQYSYPKATIKLECFSETEVITKFLNKETEAIVTGRDLTDDERNYIKDLERTFAIHKIATDAVAFIVHKDFPLDELSKEQILAVFAGQHKKWESLDHKLSSQNIDIVFDRSGSSNYKILTDSLHFNKENLNVFAAGTNEKVFEYVRSHPEALGIIGANWISDYDDPQVKERLKHVKVLDVSVKNQEGVYVAYNPFQSDLMTDHYPFLRNIYYINYTSRTGLPTGLASFILSDRGQRIMLKSGLMPAQIPAREIQIRN
ncbi:MAG: PstS family phosphate ABC transporter substrate-binding protein [Cytophagaceae bacterium]